ncbi:MAG TPA: hypothetical protein VLN45_13170 [Ignavibacteriaceae bacterium]|nr:hypothetical protein [Ignavibacteriaceae bacterium]
MSQLKISSLKGFEDINTDNFSDSFVPYLYLDGHRSSSIGSSDSERYDGGFKFFMRFIGILKELGFRNLVTMVHTSRNCNVNGRVDSIHSAIQKNFNSLNGEMSSLDFKLYGDIEKYNSLGYQNFYNFLKSVEENSSRDSNFTNHILINYSEEWAINNLAKINLIPKISSVIRFTKGFVSGGWIPLKMQEATFIYSQIPSISDFWTDEAITALILISLKNWSMMTKYIGKKVYEEGEKETIHIERDIELKLFINKLDIKSHLKNRIIAFDIKGPIIYEL